MVVATPCLIAIKSAVKNRTNSINQEIAMQWTTPAFTDLRFGFEVTMYIANR